jgi:hypothetical protein
MSGEDLIMELTTEHGPGTITRVQPPLVTWEVYFRVDLEDPPSLILRNQRSRAARPENRLVLQHDRSWSLEISETEITSPAIVRFHRTGWNRYDYWVYGSDHPEYASCRWMLDSFPNPHHHGGRKWLVI